MHTDVEARSDGERFLTVEEVAGELGVTGPTVRLLIVAGGLPARNIGRPGGARRVWRVSSVALAEWVRGQ